MVDIGRPFTKEELEYIEKNRAIIENGELKDLPSTEGPGYTDELIYFLAACIRNELKFDLVETVNDESRYRLNSNFIEDPLGLGTDKPIKLLIRLASRFNIDPERLRQILIEFWIAEDGSKTR